MAVKNFRSAKGERKNINLRAKTHQNDRIREQTRARQSKQPECSCTELRLNSGSKVQGSAEELAHTDMEAAKAPTYVKGALSSTLPIHSVHQIAGHRFEEQTEDGHADTETLCITEVFTWRVEDRDVNDVCEDCEQQASQELETRTENGTWTEQGFNHWQ